MYVFLVDKRSFAHPKWPKIGNFLSDSMWDREEKNGHVFLHSVNIWLQLYLINQLQKNGKENTNHKKTNGKKTPELQVYNDSYSTFHFCIFQDFVNFLLCLLWHLHEYLNASCAGGWADEWPYGPAISSQSIIIILLINSIIITSVCVTRVYSEPLSTGDNQGWGTTVNKVLVTIEMLFWCNWMI